MTRLMTIAAIGAVWLTAACSSPAATGAGAGPRVSASEKEFSITLASPNSAPGTVTFDVKNDGTVAHEFIVVRTDSAADKLPLASGKVDETQLTAAGEVADVAPGTTRTFTAELAAGHYVVLCNLPGHYAAGMHQDLTVR